jgi:hypothetical protein
MRKVDIHERRTATQATVARSEFMRIGLSKQVAVFAGVAVTVAAAATLTGCAPKSSATSWQSNGTPVHNDPNAPWQSYQLVYHPNSGVYFEPYSHTWHWQERGEWRSSKTRPEPVAWRTEEAIVVKLNWDTPEYGHTTVAALHPQRRSWDRLHPITVAPTANENTALTSAPESAEDTSGTDSISLGATPNKAAPGAPGAPGPGASESPASAITGVTETNNPE